MAHAYKQHLQEQQARQAAQQQAGQGADKAVITGGDSTRGETALQLESHRSAPLPTFHSLGPPPVWEDGPLAPGGLAAGHVAVEARISDNH